ncbi:MAG: hypothetical protein ACE5EY_15785, partial [Anaerolineae bacterium]
QDRSGDGSLMDGPTPAPRFGRYGSALVALDDERTALAAVLVLQEMGLTVDIAADRDSAFQWAAGDDHGASGEVVHLG